MQVGNGGAGKDRGPPLAVMEQAPIPEVRAALEALATQGLPALLQELGNLLYKLRFEEGIGVSSMARVLRERGWDVTEAKLGRELNRMEAARRAVTKSGQRPSKGPAGRRGVGGSPVGASRQGTQTRSGP